MSKIKRPLKAAKAAAPVKTEKAEKTTSATYETEATTVHVLKTVPNRTPEQKTKTIAIQKFATDTMRVSVTNGTKQSDGNYGSAQIAVTVSVPGYVEEANELYEHASKLVEEFLGKEIEKSGIYGDADSEEEEAAPKKAAKASKEKPAKGKKAAEPEEDEEESSDDDDEGVTEEMIRTMKRPALLKLISQYDIEVDPEEFEGIKELREAVIEALSDSDDEEEEEEDDDDDSEEEDDSDDSDDEDEEDSEDDEDEESDDDEEEEDEEESDDEESGWYSKEDLEGAELSDLIEVAKEHGIKVSVDKKAAPKIKHKAYVKAILAHGDE